MRLIYADEAGTARDDPIKVVVGVTIKSDEAWRAASASLQKAFEFFVPKQIQSGFVFHAKDLFTGRVGLSIEQWGVADRIKLFHAVLMIPGVLKLPVSVGAVAKGSFGPLSKADLSPAEADHFGAAYYMLNAADLAVRKYGGPHELAFVVCEKVPERERHLRKALAMLQSRASVLSPEEARSIKTHSENFRVTAERIRDSIHFAAKQHAPLLQLADACAFTFRRYLSKQRGGDDLLHALLGQRSLEGSWCDPGSSVTFFPS